MKKATKHQRRVLTETVTGITAMSMTVTATGMTVMGMVVTAHISHLARANTERPFSLVIPPQSEISSL
eukprot:2181376-Ditylum_brightwellii.AAC.1